MLSSLVGTERMNRVAAKKKEEDKHLAAIPGGKCRPDFLIALIGKVIVLNCTKALPAGAGNIKPAWQIEL